MNRRSSHRSNADPPPSFEAVQSKLFRIVLRHEQLKFAFHQLHSQIRTGLHEAEDALASLAIPLMKLVGLKTAEMAADGRFSTLLISKDRPHSQEDYYMMKAMTAGNEMMERQKLWLMQLISLLKKIEAQVNSSQNSIFKNLADHQAFIKKLYIKTFTYVSAIQQSGQSSDLSLMMLKILKATFDRVGVALRSVEVGIDDLISELAEKMCNPMVEYVNGLKVEMRAGTCAHLLEIIKEMDGAMKVRTFELEEARKQARLAEQSRTKALSELKESEGTARKMTVSLGLLIDDAPVSEAPKSEENSTQQKLLRLKLLGKREDQAKDDNRLWDLLRTTRKCQAPDSPLGPKGLLGIGTCNKKPKLERAIPSLSYRPLTRSQSKGSNPHSSFINSRILLGSSPSVPTQKVLCRKRITPRFQP